MLLLVVVAELAGGERDIVQVERPLARMLGLLELERPVDAPVREAFEVDGRIDEVDGRNHDAACDQRQRLDFEADRVERGEMLRARPVRVGDRDVARAEARPRHPCAPALLARGPAPLDAQVAVDRERPSDRIRYLVVDPRARAVPVERHDEDEQRGNRQGNDNGEPCGHLADGVAVAHLSLPVGLHGNDAASRVPEARFDRPAGRVSGLQPIMHAGKPASARGSSQARPSVHAACFGRRQSARTCCRTGRNVSAQKHFSIAHDGFPCISGFTPPCTSKRLRWHIACY